MRWILAKAAHIMLGAGTFKFRFEIFFVALVADVAHLFLVWAAYQVVATVCALKSHVRFWVKILVTTEFSKKKQNIFFVSKKYVFFRTTCTTF